jgi:hypothetical protein
MTRVRFRSKPCWHESEVIDWQTGRTFCVAESPAALLIRLKGKRQTLSLPWSIAYLRAATLKASADALAKSNGKHKPVQVTRGRV